MWAGWLLAPLAKYVDSHVRSCHGERMRTDPTQDATSPPTPGSTAASRVRVDTAGRVVIPSSLRSLLQIAPGDELLVSTDGSGIRLRTFAHVIKDIQAEMAPYRREGESVVDELLAERREEARREYGE